MLLRKFLNLVLPTEGSKCWVEISQDKKVIQGFSDTVDGLADKLLEIDSRGVDAYFACASFKQPINRRAANALGAKSFWLDIDAGEGKPYATANDATDALDEFCNRINTVLPGVVRSGNGIHAYWILDRFIEAGSWREAAKRLKLLTQHHGLHADPTRTADISSILRPPGTNNYKLSKEDVAEGRLRPASPRSVEIFDWEYFKEINYDEFSSCLLADIPTFHDIHSASNGNASSEARTNQSLTAGITVSKAFDPTKGITEGGRNEACARYAGELFAKGLDFNDVLQRCLKWNDLNTPPMDAQEVRTTVTSISHKHQEKHPALPVAEEELPAPPYGFKWGPAKQLMVIVKTKSLTEKDKWDIEEKIVSHLPVYMKAWMNEEGHKQKNSYLFCNYHPKRGWQQFSMSTKEYNGEGWYGAFSENGCSIVEGMDKYFKSYVRRAEVMLRMPGNEQIKYSQFGWKHEDQAFLVGDSLCKADGTVEQAFGTDKLAPLMKTMMPARGGSQEKWTLAADKLYTPGMEAHGFMLLAGFAAPLMKFCVDEGNGGSVFSVVSEDSGKGKTPLAAGIASIWGELGSTIITGNFTDNRGIDELVRRCHLPLIKEEGAYSDPLIASQGIEKFTSGTDRGRLTQSGASAGTPERYQTILLSLSNKSLHGLVKMVNIPMSKRIFEVDIGNPGEEIISNLGGITREMIRNCGYAGLQYSRLIVAPKMHDYIVEHLTGKDMSSVGAVQLKYRHLLASQPEHRFIVWLLSAVDVAARIVTHCGILNFDVDRIMAWAVDEARLKMHGIKGTTEEDASALLNSFLSDHTDNCLTVPREFSSKWDTMTVIKTPSRNLWLRLELKNERLYIAQEALEKWCIKRGMRDISFGKALKVMGVVLETGKKVSLGAGTGIVSTRTPCWEIDMGHPIIAGGVRAVLSEEEEERKAIMLEGNF